MPENKFLIYAVHGFLGRSSDWNFLKNEFGADSILAVDLFTEKSSFELKAPDCLDHLGSKKIFIGYSLGGRLGLSFLKKKPNSFDQYIFISTNPGLLNSDLDTRKERKLSDANWADKINKENWPNFIREWNSQAVFQGNQFELQRKFEDYDPSKLKEALIERSLANQEDCRLYIKKNKEKINWIVGSQDLKFFKIANELKSEEIILNYHLIESGHRVIFDAQAELINLLKKLIG